jgi:polar amino acid transport system permease protein
MSYTFDFSVVWREFDNLIQGLALDLLMATASILMGAVIGVFVAFALVSKDRTKSKLAKFYVTLIRNTPILIIILFVYFALPDLGITLNQYQSFILALTVYAGAYIAEVLRGGIQALPKGTKESALAIGLTPIQTNRIIILPIVIRSTLASMSNNFISLFKDTSLAATIAVPELTFYTREINVETFRVIEAWSVTSVLYVLTCLIIAVLLRRVEKRYAIIR